MVAVLSTTTSLSPDQLSRTPPYSPPLLLHVHTGLGCLRSGGLRLCPLTQGGGVCTGAERAALTQGWSDKISDTVVGQLVRVMGQRLLGDGAQLESGAPVLCIPTSPLPPIQPRALAMLGTSAGW